MQVIRQNDQRLNAERPSTLCPEECVTERDDILRNAAQTLLKEKGAETVTQDVKGAGVGKTQAPQVTPR